MKKQSEKKPTEFAHVMRGLVGVSKTEVIEAEKKHLERIRNLREKKAKSK